MKAKLEETYQQEARSKAL